MLERVKIASEQIVFYYFSFLGSAHGLHIMHEHKVTITPQSNFWLIAVGAKTMDSNYGDFFSLPTGTWEVNLRLNANTSGESVHVISNECYSHLVLPEKRAHSYRLAFHYSLTQSRSFNMYLSFRFTPPVPITISFFFHFFLSVVWNLNSYFAVQQQLTVTSLPIRSVCALFSAYR